MNRRKSPKRLKAREFSETLLRAQPPLFDAFHIKEPKLIFSGGGLSVDPKDGIEKFGPIENDRTAYKSIKVGIVGTSLGTQKTAGYIEACASPVRAGLNSRGKPYNLLSFPDFPGCNENTGFRCDLEAPREFQRILTDTQIKGAVGGSDDTERIKSVVEMLRHEIEQLSDLDSSPDVVVAVLPAIIEEACAAVGNRFRAQKIKLTFAQKRDQKERKKLDRTGQNVFDFLFQEDGDEALSPHQRYWNLHHAFKANVMDLGIPTQMLWESTLKDGGGSQDPASKAWNFVTALYYKSGAVPWHIKELSHNTCYVGISFYKESPHADASMQTSLAQVFGAQQGLILKGSRAEFDKSRDRKPHLSKSDAQALLENAIKAYTDQNKHPPRRVVVHKTSRYWPEEIEGLRRGIGNTALHDFLTLEFLDKRFMRIGKNPPLRGTMIILSERNYLLFTSGYVPYLRVYPGMRIPRPLEIVEHHGDSTANEVCTEILALTKINWNSCHMCSSLPITLRFSKSVGQILAELRAGTKPQSKYRFYM